MEPFHAPFRGTRSPPLPPVSTPTQQLERMSVGHSHLGYSKFDRILNLTKSINLLDKQGEIVQNVVSLLPSRTFLVWRKNFSLVFVILLAILSARTCKAAKQEGIV